MRSSKNESCELFHSKNSMKFKIDRSSLAKKYTKYLKLSLVLSAIGYTIGLSLDSAGILSH